MKTLLEAVKTMANEELKVARIQYQEAIEWKEDRIKKEKSPTMIRIHKESIEELTEAIQHINTKLAEVTEQNEEELNLNKFIGTTQEVIALMGGKAKRKIFNDEHGFYVSHCGYYINVEWLADENKFKMVNTLASICEERKQRNEEKVNKKEEVTMKNSTSIKVPAKYHHMIDEIYQDADGYWIVSKKGYYVAGMGKGCHEAHEDTKKDLLDMIKTLKPCECGSCK